MFDFVPRSCNRAAHELAKVGLSSDSDVEWSAVMPGQLSLLINPV